VNAQVQKAPAVDRILDRVLTLLDAEGRAPAARSIRQQRNARRSARPVIVVAGEDKRGKSSLVNALLAQADLSPVGSKVVTGSPITFFHSEHPTASIWRYGSAESQEVDVATAQRLATVDGNPGNEENIQAIRIGLDLPLLTAMDLVDTPGVGGLSSGHAALTLQSLNTADALLFVVDATAPMRASELAFLRRAAQRLQAVILVVTKTDAHPGWRQIMQDDRAVLAEQAPRFAGSPAVGVSSASSLRALALDDPDFAAEIRAESGIAQLEELLRERVAGAVDTVRVQNLLRAVVTALAVLERDLLERQQAVEPGGTALAELRQERRRLVQLRQDRIEWPGRLETEIRKLTLNRAGVCARRALEIRNRYLQRAETAGKSEFLGMPGELLAELTALAGELNEMAARELSTIMSELLDGLEAQDVLRRGIAEIAGGSLHDQLTPFAANGRRLQHGDKMMLLSELGRGRSLLSLASGTSAIAFLAPPFGLVLGVGLGGMFAFQAWRERSLHGRLAEFRFWANEQISNAQLTINNGFALQVVDLQAEIRASIRRVLGEREQQLTESLDAALDAQKQEEGQRRAAAAQLTARIATAKNLRLEAARLLATLSQADGNAP
jgi:GTP-binding protein EngB required for normal cell division